MCIDDRVSLTSPDPPCTLIYYPLLFSLCFRLTVNVPMFGAGLRNALTCGDIFLFEYRVVELLRGESILSPGVLRTGRFIC